MRLVGNPPTVSLARAYSLLISFLPLASDDLAPRVSISILKNLGMVCSPRQNDPSITFPVANRAQFTRLPGQAQTLQAVPAPLTRVFISLTPLFLRWRPSVYWAGETPRKIQRDQGKRARCSP